MTKTYLLFMLSILTSSISYGQATAEVKNYYTEVYKQPIYESYQITIPDSLRNGKYESFFITGHIGSVGYYKNNKRIGIWKFYRQYDEKLSLQYDFDHNQILGPAFRNEEPSEGFILEMIPEYEPNSIWRFVGVLGDSIRKNKTIMKMIPYYMEYTIQVDSNGKATVKPVENFHNKKKFNSDEMRSVVYKKEIDEFVIRFIEGLFWIPRKGKSVFDIKSFLLPLDLK